MDMIKGFLHVFALENTLFDDFDVLEKYRILNERPCP